MLFRSQARDDGGKWLRRNKLEGLGDHQQFITEGDADANGAVVEGQNAHELGREFGFGANGFNAQTRAAGRTSRRETWAHETTARREIAFNFAGGSEKVEGRNGANDRTLENSNASRVCESALPLRSADAVQNALRLICTAVAERSDDTA